MTTLSKDIFAVPDGGIHPRWFRAGEQVSGQVARAAAAQGAIAPAANASPEIAPEAPRKRGRPAKKAMASPENK